MAQSPNQFGQSVVKGQVLPGSQSLPVEVDATSAALTAGQCVEIMDSAGGVPKVKALVDDDNAVFGVIPYDARRASIKPGEQIEMLFGRTSIVYMEASAAIARGASVMPVVAGSKVATATSGKRVIGMAIDKAAAAGDLIRVALDLPGNLLA